MTGNDYTENYCIGNVTRKNEQSGKLEYSYTISDRTSNGFSLPAKIQMPQVIIRLSDNAYGFNFTDRNSYSLIKNTNGGNLISCEYRRSSKTLQFASDYARDGGTNMILDEGELKKYVQKIYLNSTITFVDITKISGYEVTFSIKSKSPSNSIGQIFMGKSSSEVSVINTPSGGDDKSYAYYGDTIIIRADEAGTIIGSITNTVKNKYLKIKIKLKFKDGTSVEKEMTQVDTYTHEIVIDKETVSEITGPIDNFAFIVDFNEAAYQMDEYYIYTLSSDGTYYSIAAKTTALSGDLILPSEYNGLPIKEITRNGFKNLPNITSITLPETITKINSSAFQNCTAQSINIPKSVTEIGMGAFQNCLHLKSIIIPDGITTIDIMTFSGCSSLKEVTIPDSVTSFKTAAFSGCDAIEYAKAPAAAFCPSQGSDTKLISVKNLITVEITSGQLKEYMFTGCSSLTTVILNNTITSIPDGTFRNCGLINITLSDKITSIGYEAFYYCNLLKYITIPNSIISIGDYAFMFASSLKSITIGSNLKTIGQGAFENCEDLNTISYRNTRQKWSQVTKGTDWNKYTGNNVGGYKVVCIDGQA